MNISPLFFSHTSFYSTYFLCKNLYINNLNAIKLRSFILPSAQSIYKHKFYLYITKMIRSLNRCLDKEGVDKLEKELVREKRLVI